MPLTMIALDEVTWTTGLRPGIAVCRLFVDGAGAARRAGSIRPSARAPRLRDHFPFPPFVVQTSHSQAWLARYSGALAGRPAHLALLAVLASCNVNPHYIGDVCPGAPDGTNACVTFSVGLDVSGVSQLPVGLTLPTGAVQPIERLRGETAMDGVWTAEVGAELRP